jgi:hypothetical protein
MATVNKLRTCACWNLSETKHLCYITSFFTGLCVPAYILSLICTPVDKIARTQEENTAFSFVPNNDFHMFWGLLSWLNNKVGRKQMLIFALGSRLIKIFAGVCALIESSWVKEHLPSSQWGILQPYWRLRYCGYISLKNHSLSKLYVCLLLY